MATYPCLGTGPVSFLDANSSQQEIPLSAIVFGANGPDASQWPGYPANKAVVDPLLTQMSKAGLLVPNIETSLAKSLTVQAVR